MNLGLACKNADRILRLILFLSGLVLTCLLTAIPTSPVPWSDVVRRILPVTRLPSEKIVWKRDLVGPFGLIVLTS